MLLCEKLTEELKNQMVDTEVIKLSEVETNTQVWVEYAVKQHSFVDFIITFAIREEENYVSLMNVYPIGGFVSMYLLKDIETAIKNAKEE